MNLKIRHLLLAILALGTFFIICSGISYAQPPFVFSPGEELYYEVSFLGVKLGSIKIVSEGTQKVNGKNTFKAKGFVDTYKGIPFVDIHVIIESWMDQTVAFSHKFNGHWKDKDGWDFDEQIFDYKNQQINVAKWKGKQNFFKKTFKTSKQWNDGLSLFFFARKFTGVNRGVKVPTLMDKDTATTSINFSNKRENIDIDAVSYPVRTVYLNGIANWTGLYGLSGKFEGWFSDDDARVPIKAKMKVYVGNINIELKSWKRAGWGPPRGQ